MHPAQLLFHNAQSLRIIATQGLAKGNGVKMNNNNNMDVADVNAYVSWVARCAQHSSMKL